MTADETRMQQVSELAERDKKEKGKEIMEALRAATPNWLREPQPGAEGYRTPPLGANPWPLRTQGASDDFQAPFPLPTATTTTPTETATSDVNDYGFKMIDASETDDNGNPVFKVLIFDGYVNGQLPSGMGNDDFILPVGGDGYKIWVEVTYNANTLAITPPTINQGPVIPDSSLGNAFLLLGDVSVTDTSLTPRNAQCGDINVSFIYGALNGAAAIYLLSQVDDPQSTP
jgi:hypothetical protein